MATPEDLAETVREVEALGRRIVAAQVEVRDYEALDVALCDAVGELGDSTSLQLTLGLDIGAGRRAYGSGVERVIDVDLTAMWHTAKVALPHLRAGARADRSPSRRRVRD